MKTEKQSQTSASKKTVKSMPLSGKKVANKVYPMKKALRAVDTGYTSPAKKAPAKVAKKLSTKQK